MPDQIPRPSRSGPQPTPEKACPICGKPAEAQHRPFCSKRCADVDLHRWLGGAYAIPVPDDNLPGSVEDEESAR